MSDRRRRLEALEAEVRRELGRFYGRRVVMNGRLDDQVRQVVDRALASGIPVAQACEACPLLQAYLRSIQKPPTEAPEKRIEGRPQEGHSGAL